PVREVLPGRLECRLHDAKDFLRREQTTAATRGLEQMRPFGNELRLRADELDFRCRTSVECRVAARAYAARRAVDQVKADPRARALLHRHEHVSPGAACWQKKPACRDAGAVTAWRDRRVR